jgi:predicted Fe-S protein YdhL (DUF1289 family)
MPVSTLVSPFRRVRERLVAGVLTSGGRMTSGRSRVRRREALLSQATTNQGPCQMRSKTESPCLHRAVAEIQGIPLCEGCAREQEAYFAVGELTQETQDPRSGTLGKMLGEALDGMRRERADGLAVTRRLTMTR